MISSAAKLRIFYFAFMRITFSAIKFKYIIMCFAKEKFF